MKRLKIRHILRQQTQYLNDPHNKHAAWIIASIILVCEIILNSLIIWKVPYSEIDWEAYMQEVEGFLKGERNYLNLKGGTGPLVYPAGFVYLYSALFYITNGGDILIGQIIFAILYIMTQFIVLYLYIEAELLPPWALGLLSLSKRIHSIYVLRLFNDCWSSLFTYFACAFLINKKWIFAIIMFSAGVSIKMNVLLFVPPVLFVVVQYANIFQVVVGSLLGVLLQIFLAFPFLLTYPYEYFSRAFEFGRVFMYKWTVNFKFIDQQTFVSKQLALGLLIAHLFILGIFSAFKWKSSKGDFSTTFQRFLKGERNESIKFKKQFVIYVLFSGNFVGIVCARSLHYQFYSWYFHTIPFLLWCTPYLSIFRITLWLLLEIVWNVYPATAFSSLMLLFCHVSILVGLFLWQSKDEKEKAG
eukprot:TRINITY_DN100_c2_g1_i3.p1 TRINITY_DN100_c2_g1~~TRINITY_DN100_c2_g1_i3.p1  ORF type:complete len:414 (+),score=16.31 TRINITY_DN100_c2_g1_i3:380-1621(+)